MRKAGLFNYFRGDTLAAVCFNRSRWLIKIGQLNDDKPLRMSPTKADCIRMMLLFITCALFYIPGGCAGKRQTEPPPDEVLRAAIEENVLDETRRAELLTLSEQFSGILEELLAATNKTSQELDQLLVDYHSDRKSFERTFEHYNQKRQELSLRIIVLYYDVKVLTTPEEWETIEAVMIQLASTQMNVRLHRR